MQSGKSHQPCPIATEAAGGHLHPLIIGADDPRLTHNIGPPNLYGHGVGMTVAISI